MVHDDEKGTCLVYVKRLMWLSPEMFQLDLLFSLLKTCSIINQFNFPEDLMQQSLTSPSFSSVLLPRLRWQVPVLLWVYGEDLAKSIVQKHGPLLW